MTPAEVLSPGSYLKAFSFFFQFFFPDLGRIEIAPLLPKRLNEKNVKLWFSKNNVKGSVCMRMEKAMEVSVKGVGRGELNFAVHSFGLFHLLQVVIALFINIPNKI